MFNLPGGDIIFKLLMGANMKIKSQLAVYNSKTTDLISLTLV